MSRCWGPNKAQLLANCVEKAKTVSDCRVWNSHRLFWTVDVTCPKIIRHGTFDNSGKLRIPTRIEHVQISRRLAWQILLIPALAMLQRSLKPFKHLWIFLFLDNNKDGYFACFQAIEQRLMNPATIVADNVGRADQMADYLEHVRSHYESETHWFESRRPGRRDGMEVSIYRR